MPITFRLVTCHFWQVISSRGELMPIKGISGKRSLYDYNSGINPINTDQQ
ncbi:hypothetical protein DR73_140 [Enterobacteriaceae bacterium ATCC 29904]|nr:hypothetical protein DR73_140 [Enterobacteriaceae bacterium ATCC 29904]